MIFAGEEGVVVSWVLRGWRRGFRTMMLGKETLRED